MVKFLEGTVARLVVPGDQREIVVFDDSLPGFGVRKSGTGKASYLVKYRVGGKQRKMTLGPVAPGNLAQMRRMAADIMAKARAGQDEAGERQAAASETSAKFGELVPRFLKSKEGSVVPEYHYQLGLFLNRYWQPLHNAPIEQITRAQIVKLLDKLVDEHGAVGADRAKAALSGLFAWAIERSYLDLSPVQGIKRRASKVARDRVLTEAELVTIWRACDEYDYGRIIKLLILTGQRKSEIGDLSWLEVNFQNRQIEFGASRTKNRRAHIVPFSDSAVTVLRSIPRRDRDLIFGAGDGGFSGWSKSKKRLDGRLPADMVPWTVHDIRRSVATHLGELGFADPHVIEAILNHVSGAKASIAGVYNRAVYSNEKRRALAAWGEHIRGLVDA